MCRHAIDSRVDLSKLCLGLVTCLVAQCFATTGNAQPLWTNPAGGFWHAGSNWAGGSPPAPGGTAIFSVPNTYNVLWNDGFGNSVSGGLLVNGGNATFSNTSPSTRTWSVSGNSLISGSGTRLTVGSIPGNIMHLTSGGVVVNSGGQLVATGGSTISTPGLLTLGSAGSGTLTAQAGGIINALLARIGDGGSGTALVTGAGSQLNIGPQFGESLMVGYSGTGLLNIQNGGLVTASSTTSFIGLNAGSTGTVNVTGAGSRLILDSVWQDDLAIGNGGTGLLNILDGGFVTNRQAFVGAGATGTINVSGAGSTWQMESLRMCNGSLNVQSGGMVTMSNGGLIGEGPGDNNTVTVSGAGSSLTGGLAVGGFSSTGVLNILDGGDVFGAAGSVGLFEGSTGTATVSGNGSTWNMTGRLDVGVKNLGGPDCHGVLNIESGGLVTSVGGRLGDGFGNASGTVTVTGAGSSWINSGFLDIGLDGTGIINVENQGQVSVVGFTAIGNGTLNVTSGGVVANAIDFVGAVAGSTGTATVTGSGSRWDNGFELNVGGLGTGTLNVEAGGVVTTPHGLIGRFAGSTGTATVTGSGSQWINSPFLFVGHEGAGTLHVAAGGVVTAEHSAIGLVSGSSGTVTVTGSGSQWNNTGSLIVGQVSNGILNVTAGGVVTNPVGFVGNEPGSVGTVTVTGSGSQWNNIDSLQVGRFGTGTLNIADGGSVTTVNLTAIDAAGQINNSDGSLISNTMINQAGGEILGRGLFSAIGGWSNSGFMAFQGGVSDVYGTVNNLPGGTIFAEFFGTTFFHGDVVHNGVQIAVGQGSSIEFLGTVSGAGNYFSGGLVTMHGAFRPGNGTGVVSFASGLTFAAENTTYIELSGENQGQFDQLLVGGNLSLGNSHLDVSLVGGNFNLEPGMEFLIADVNGSLLGQFAGLGEGSLVGNFGGTNLFITYNGIDGNAGVGLYTLANPVILGDVNGDGVVNLLDVSSFVNVLTSGVFQPEADINQDSVVNLLDVSPFVTILTGG